MAYKFNEQITKLYGVNEAIFMQNLYWWIEKNRQSEINYYTVKLHNKNGEIFTVSDYWTYNSMRAFQTERQIRTIVYNFRRKGLIITSNLNKMKHDKTMWYTLTNNVKKVYENSQTQLTEKSNGFGQNVTPIPDRKLVTKPDNKLTKESLNNNLEKQIFHEKSEPYMLARFLEGQI